MIRHASPSRPRHRSRPTPERLEDRLQPNSLGGLWEDLALGRPAIAARPRTPEVASMRQHQARIGQAYHGRTIVPSATRPARAHASRPTTSPGPQLPIPIFAIPTATSPTTTLSPVSSPSSSPAPVLIPSSPSPTPPTTQHGPSSTQPSPAPTSVLQSASTSSAWTPFPDGGGYELTSWGPNGSMASSIAMWTPPGGTQQIVTAGVTYGSTSNSNSMTVARYNTDGTPDTSFGSGGVATTLLGGWTSFGAMALQTDGKVVGAGFYQNQGLLAARYNTNGTLDTTFNGTGWTNTSIDRTSGSAYAVGLQSNGNIVVAGKFTPPHSSSAESLVLCYTPTGQLESGKGGFGQVTKNGSALGYTTMSFGPNNLGFEALAIQPDDKIVAVGGILNRSTTSYAQLTLMRFTANGLPDPGPAHTRSPWI